MKKKFLLTGFGFMGQTHAWSLINHPNAELIGIIDPCDPFERLSIKGNRATSSVTEKDIRKIPHYTDLTSALSAEIPDGIVVALPTKFHCSAVIEALKAGVNVFVEKPIAIKLQECRDMIRTAAEKKKLLAVGQVVRFMREYQFLKETVDSKRLGSLKLMRLSRYTGIPTWGNWSDPEFVRASGGPLFDLVSHDIDFVRSCLGEPEKILANNSLDLDRQKLNLIMAEFTYPGLTVQIEGGFVSPPSIPFQRTFTAYFENGTLQSTQTGELKEYIGTEIIPHDFSYDNPYRTEVDAFIQAVCTGDHSGICHGEDAFRTIQACRTIAEQIRYPLPE